MGNSLERSSEAGLKAPVKAALMVGVGRLDILVHRGAAEYAAALTHEAEDTPGRHQSTQRVLLAIAQAVLEASR